MRRKTLFRRWFALVIALVMVTMGVPAMAAETTVDGSKTATELTDRQTTVTLSLPSAESHYKYDIVFVMDSSTSTVNSEIDFSVYANDLFSTLIEKNAEIRVGVIKCRGLAFDTIELVSNKAKSGMVEYSDDTAAIISDAVNYKEADLNRRCVYLS